VGQFAHPFGRQAWPPPRYHKEGKEKIVPQKQQQLNTVCQEKDEQWLNFVKDQVATGVEL